MVKQWNSQSFSFVIVLLVVVFSLFNNSIAKLLEIWLESNTYGHGILIFPIALWLIHGRRAELSKTAVAPSHIALFFVAAISAVWFVGVLSLINVLEQFAFISLFIALTWAVYGWPLIRQIKFPLAFLFLAIPVGDFLIPYLQFITADISVFLVKLLGIPVYRDGMYIQIPNGNFLVAEACSGIRFLISTFTIGVLFAYLNFNKLSKQVFFVVLCIVVAIVGNGLRAFLMILIGHLSNMKAAVGFDHLVYGWVFFSIIVAILLVLGHYMADPVTENDDNNAKPLPREKATYPSTNFLLMLTLCIVLGPLLNIYYGQKMSVTSAQLANNEPVVDYSALPWSPQFPEADNIVNATITIEDNTIDLFEVSYLHEEDGKEVISFKNRMFDPEKWSLKSQSIEQFSIDDKTTIPYVSYTIVNLQGIQRTVRVIYQAGDRYIANTLVLKLALLINKITMQDFGARIIFLSSTNKHHADKLLDAVLAKTVANESSPSLYTQLKGL